MRYIIIFLLVSLTSCATSKDASYEKLAYEVNAVVKNTMPSTQVQSELEKLGFNCNEGTSDTPNKRGVFECLRYRRGLLFTCIHRIRFDSSSNDSLISDFTIHEPACASL